MKYQSLISYGLGGISVILIGAFMFNTESDLLLDLMMYWAYFLVGFAILITLLFPLINTIKNPKSAMSGLAGLVAVIVVVGISYAFSSSTPIVTPATVYDNAMVLKLSDTGLYTTYVAFAATILSIIGCEIAKTFK